MKQAITNLLVKYHLNQVDENRKDWESELTDCGEYGFVNHRWTNAGIMETPPTVDQARADLGDLDTFINRNGSLLSEAFVHYAVVVPFTYLFLAAFIATPFYILAHFTL